MSPDIQVEIHLLLRSAVLGAVLMMSYDVLRIFRLVVRHNWQWIGIEDFCYWVGCGFAVFYLLYQENDGALRMYVIVEVLLTMLLYDRIFSINFLKLLKKAGKCIKLVIRRVALPGRK